MPLGACRNASYGVVSLGNIDILSAVHALYLAFLRALMVHEPPKQVTRSMNAAVALLLSLSAVVPANAAAADGDRLLAVMDAELERTFGLLSEAPTPAYFVAYRVIDRHAHGLSASFGALTGESSDRRRRLFVEARTGSYQRDNTHALRSDGLRWGINYRHNWSDLPLADDPEPIRLAIWRATDRVYQQALDHLSKVETNTVVKVAEEDAAPDFSREDPVVLLEPEQPLEFESWIWKDKLRRYSARFAGNAHILVGRVTLGASNNVSRFVNSEGTRVRKTDRVFRLHLEAVTKADDGMELPLQHTFLARRVSELPSDAEVLARVDALIAQADALRAAPIVTAYQGPVLLEGRASAVFFHELLGHRVEGHRLRREEDAQTFKRKLGERILPPGFRVYFDPTVDAFAGTALVGSYAVDDEGVPGRRVDVIEDGVLKTFLMSRIPIEGHPRSNGHGRAQAIFGRTPVARQSNLFVEVDGAVSRERLRRDFLAALDEQQREWGLIIRDVEGGFTGTGRIDPNALKVIPTVVYKVYPDGREELARGVDVIGTPLLTLSHVRAAADDAAVIHGWCGAESGFVPVSLIAPSIYLDRLEVQRKPKSQVRPPLLPNPVPEDR